MVSRQRLEGLLELVTHQLLRPTGTDDRIALQLIYSRLKGMLDAEA